MTLALDSLPDEVLLIVLAAVADAASLLDAVPRVCRRWRRLARTAAAWGGVRVRWAELDEDNDGLGGPSGSTAASSSSTTTSPSTVSEASSGSGACDGGAVVDAKRVVLCAPALHCLVLEPAHRPGVPPSPAALAMASALRRSRVRVLHRLAVQSATATGASPVTAAAVGLAHRVRAHLRVLRLTLAGDDAPPSLREAPNGDGAPPQHDGVVVGGGGAEAGDDEAVRDHLVVDTLMGVVARCSQLRRLEIRFLTASPYPYRGELAQGRFPHLRQIVILEAPTSPPAAWPSPGSVPDDTLDGDDELVRDLLRGAGNALKRVSITPYSKTSLDLAVTMARSRNFVESLSVTAIWHGEDLEAVRLSLHSEDADDAIACFRLLTEGCLPVGTVKHVFVDVMLGDALLRHVRHVRDTCQRLAAGAAAVRADMSVHVTVGCRGPASAAAV